MPKSERTPAPWVRIEQLADGSIKLDGQASAMIGHQVPMDGRPRPGGVYVCWEWNGQELVVENDRAGMGQMFYAVLGDGGGVALSPHVDHLLELGAAAEIDDDALSILLRLGFHLDVDTPYKSIRAFRPNSRLVWRPGELHLKSDIYRFEPQSITRAQAVEGYVELFRQAIGRRPSQPKQTVVPLTGGNDSRHIVFELCRRCAPPDLCVTVRRYPRVMHDDAAVAASIASRLGVPHERIDLRSTLVQADFAKYARTGPLSDEGGWASIMWDRIRDFACSYDGIGGDVLAMERLGSQAYGDLHPLVEQQAWPELAERILNHYAASEQAMAPLMAAASFRDCGRDRVLERIVEQLQQFADQPHPLAMFLLNSRTRREIAMMPWLLCNQLSPFYAPFLDEDLFDFLAQLPAEMFVSGGFHRQVISQGYPEWADLPYLNKQPRGNPVSKLEAIQSIAELNWYAATRLPTLLGATSRWGLQRLATRAGANSAPRRVIQHWLAVEQLLRHQRYA